MKKKYPRRIIRNCNRTSPSNRSVSIFRNLSDVEDDANAFLIIGNLAITAGNNASAEAKAAGVSRVYIRNCKDIVKVSGTGQETVIAPKIRQAPFYVRYKPSTVLHAVKK